MEPKYADLHIHTNKSDSTLTPEEVVSFAAKSGLNAISIADHDTVDAIGQVEGYAQKLGIEVVPGIEFSAEINGEEAHILGYGIDYYPESFLEKLRFLREAREKRARVMVEKLRDLKFNITFNDLLTTPGGGASSVGRMHVARVMLRKGYISSIGEAFQKYIGKDGYAYVKKHRLTPKEAIDMIRGVGGVPVLAHPGLMDLDAAIPAMVKDGLQGLEAYHYEHNVRTRERYIKMAKEYDLLITGGSDCHGIGKGRVLIGSVKLPYYFVERLKEKAIENRKT